MDVEPAGDPKRRLEPQGPVSCLGCLGKDFARSSSPALHVVEVGVVVALAAVAPAVSEDEVGECVVRHPGPRYEVIDRHLVESGTVSTVEAVSRLGVEQPTSETAERDSLRPEEELTQAVLT